MAPTQPGINDASLIVGYYLGSGINREHGFLASGSAVPEPSTWAMMLIGFAGLGFAFRQSQRSVSFPQGAVSPARNTDC
jgi:PEP-CTERM motif